MKTYELGIIILLSAMVLGLGVVTITQQFDESKWTQEQECFYFYDPSTDNWVEDCD